MDNLYASVWNKFWDVGAEDTVPTAGQIKGVRVACATPQGPVCLIEVRPMLVGDITYRVSDWNYESNLSEEDSIHFIGTVSSNSGSINLDNSDGKFVKSDQGLYSVCRVAEFRRDDAEIQAYVTVTPGTTANISQFTAFAKWSDSQDKTFSGELRDIVGLTQEMDVPNFLIKGASVSQALWRLLDLAGVGPVKIRRADGEKEHKIPVLYSENGGTLWDLIKSICRDAKYSVYADEDNVINICTKYYLFSTGGTPSWQFRGENAGPTGPYSDVVDIAVTESEPINKVKLSYEPIEVVSVTNDPGNNEKHSTLARARKTTRVLWQPDSPVSLGLATLTANLNSTDTGDNAFFLISPNSFYDNNWGQFSGYALIDQEIIKYDGSQFRFWDSRANATVTETVKNKEEFQEIQSRALGIVSFTGKCVGLSRAQFGTTAQTHQSVLNSWAAPTGLSAIKTSVSQYSKATGITERYLRINRAGGIKGKRYPVTRDLGNSYSHFFARLRIPWTRGAENTGGIVINAGVDGNGWVNSGIFIEFRATAPKNTINEITAYRVSGGNYVTGSWKGWGYALRYDKPIEVTVNKKRLSRTLNEWQIYADGHYIGSIQAPASQTTNRVGMYSRGSSAPRFDYFGASNHYADSQALYTKRLSNLMKEILQKKSGSALSSSFYLDRFDDSVRGIFYSKVEFSNGPAHSVSMIPYATEGQKVFAANGKDLIVARDDDIAAALSDVSHWGAEVLVANMADRPVLLQTENSKQYPLLFGRVVERGDAQEVEEKDEALIRMQGPREFSSELKWPTARDNVELLAKHIINVSKAGRDTVEAEVFSNHLLSVGDMVKFQYPEKNYDGSQKFVITSISNSWSNGLSTQIKAVRIL